MNLLRFIGDWLYAIWITIKPQRKEDGNER